MFWPKVPGFVTTCMALNFPASLGWKCLDILLKKHLVFPPQTQLEMSQHLGREHPVLPPQMRLIKVELFCLLQTHKMPTFHSGDWADGSVSNMFPGECGAFLQKTSHRRFSSVFSAASGWKHLLSRCKQRWFKTAVFVGPALIHRLSLRMEVCQIDRQWDRLYSRRLACQIADTQSGICTHTLTHILSPARGHIPNQVHTSIYTHIAVY